jgi:hypothetical protein
VALPAHDAGEAHARVIRDRSRQRSACLRRRNPRALHSDVDLDDDADTNPCGARRRCDLGHVVGVVHGNDDVGASSQIDKARDFLDAHDLVGDHDVADAGRGHDLGLGQLRAGDADRPRGEQALRDGRDLDALGVRSPRDAVLAARVGDARDVGIEDVEVDEQRGRVDGMPVRAAQVEPRRCAFAFH